MLIAKQGMVIQSVFVEIGVRAGNSFRMGGRSNLAVDYVLREKAVSLNKVTILAMVNCALIDHNFGGF